MRKYAQCIHDRAEAALSRGDTRGYRPIRRHTTTTAEAKRHKRSAKHILGELAWMSPRRFRLRDVLSLVQRWPICPWACQLSERMRLDWSYRDSSTAPISAPTRPRVQPWGSATSIGGSQINRRREIWKPPMSLKKRNASRRPSYVFAQEKRPVPTSRRRTLTARGRY